MLSKRRGFLRYARLFTNLPPESRVMMEFEPIESWDYTKSNMSRQLQELRIISSILYNVNKRKTQKASKPEEQYEPDYVKQYREDYKAWKKEQDERANEIELMGEFWENRTGVKMVKSKE